MLIHKTRGPHSGVRGAGDTASQEQGGGASGQESAKSKSPDRGLRDRDPCLLRNFCRPKGRRYIDNRPDIKAGFREQGLGGREEKRRAAKNAALMPKSPSTTR